MNMKRIAEYVALVILFAIAMLLASTEKKIVLSILFLILIFVMLIPSKKKNGNTPLN